MEVDLEVFPLRISLRGRQLWLGWISAEPWDYFVNESGSIAWSLTRIGLLRELSRIKYNYIQGSDSFFDLDEVLGGLRDGRIVDANLMLNLWNIFTDFYNTISGQRVRLFSPKNKKAYDALFANSDAAKVIGIEHAYICAHDLQAILNVMEAGSEMLFDSTIGAKKK